MQPPCVVQSAHLGRHQAGPGKRRPGVQQARRRPAALGLLEAEPYDVRVAFVVDADHDHVVRRVTPGAPSSDDGHRAVRVSGQPQADRPQQQSREPAPAAGPHHDQPGTGIPGGLDQRLGRVTPGEDDIGRETGPGAGDPGLRVVQQGDACLHDVRIGLPTRSRRLSTCGTDGVQDPQRVTAPCGLGGGPVEGRPGIRRVVHADQHGAGAAGCGHGSSR